VAEYLLAVQDREELVGDKAVLVDAVQRWRDSPR
jgi:hypothetical protein